MKYLIVNSDDFGYTKGINKGIIEAYTNGIVTSTSVMVDEPAAIESRDLIKYKDLSIGLHFVLPKEGVPGNIEFNRQLRKFKELVGRDPDHIDVHKPRPNNYPQVEHILADYSKENHVPVRNLGYAKLIKTFFGLNIDGSGPMDESRVTLEGLGRALEDVEDGYNELMCHVGYSDDDLKKLSSYSEIREKELKTLTSDEAKELIQDRGITLCSWKQVRVE